MRESTHESHIDGIDKEARSNSQFSILREASNAIESLELEQQGLTEADTSKAEQLSWLLPQCREAVEDVESFWQHQGRYSEDPKPRYLQAAVLLFSGRSTLRVTALQSLEDYQVLWRGDSNNILQTSRARLFILSIADTIQPARTNAMHRITMKSASQKFAPKAADICRCATLLLLLSLSQHYQLSLRDLYDLWSSLVLQHGHSESSLTNTSSFQFPELRLLDSKNSPWLHTTTRDSLYPRESLPSATQTLIFPDTIEPPSTMFRMEIWKPHGRRPQSSNRCCIWGTQPEEHTRSLGWDSIVCLQKSGVAAAFVRNLERLFNPHNSDPEYAATDRMTDMSRDWIFTLKCLYATGINDAMVDVRRAQRDLINVRYEQMADPSIGGANFCLLYMQHLEYSKELVKDLKASSCHRPPSWTVSYAPTWTEMIINECKNLERELNATYGEASRTRKLIIEQHGLAQARTTSIFALLASIFVPIGFVASFFGMNTREINGSNWKTRYFFATAIPLAVITVLIPLLAIPTINFLTRRSESFRGALKWTVFFVNFMVLVAADIWSRVSGLDQTQMSTVLAFAKLIVFNISFAFCGSQFVIAIRRIRRRRSKVLNDKLLALSDIVIRQLLWQPVFILLAATCLSIGFFLFGGIELLPYFAYFGFKIWTWRQTKKRQSLARTTTVQLERVNH